MGGSTKNQTQTTQTEIPAFLKPYLTSQANIGQSTLQNLQGQLGNAGAQQLVDVGAARQLHGPIGGEAALAPGLQGVVDGHRHARESESAPVARQARVNTGVPACGSFW